MLESFGLSLNGADDDPCTPSHTDVDATWDQFVTELRLKAARKLSFVWIKGHATKFHIDREITTTLDKRGNDAADALASAAAAHHAAPQTLIEAATKRQRVALTTHISVADLLLQRRDVLCSMSEVDLG